ncbi:hypothetical protein FOA52_012762, partial [Chlamydomonas sp. UWO 241]
GQRHLHAQRCSVVNAHLEHLHIRRLQMRAFVESFGDKHAAHLRACVRARVSSPLLPPATVACCAYIAPV